jgi:hypothetical protein
VGSSGKQKEATRKIVKGKRKVDYGLAFAVHAMLVQVPAATQSLR